MTPGIFGATRPLKNQVTAAAAAIELGARLHTDVKIWMNSGRVEGGGTSRTRARRTVDSQSRVPNDTCRFTHRGDAAYLAVAVTAPAILAGDAAGTVWFLDVPPSMISPSPQARPPSAQRQR
jgi:hypothetical protein